MLKMKKPFITLTSDFEVQTQGIGIMQAVALEINPNAHVIHLMHGLPDFNLFYAARTMETVNYMPVGYHVCVVDPGVGTKRKPIIIKVGRGDYLIGPDNGVLIPATRFLGGIKKVVEITNERYMRKPVSPVFHGRDKAKVISINKFGSLHLNIMQSEWDKFNVQVGNYINTILKNKNIKIPFTITFGDVEKGKPLIIKDDYGRMEIALNQDSFNKKYKVKISDDIIIKK